MKRVITHLVGDKPAEPTALYRLSVGLSAALTGHKVFIVPNQAMLSTLRIREAVSLDESAYRSAPVRRGDVVVYRSVKHDGVLLPSRIVGLPNETVELRDRTLHIDGVKIPESYIDADSANEKYSRTMNTVLVPPDHVFLLGDFRDLSEDSRSIGPVHLDLLIGRIVIRERT